MTEIPLEERYLAGLIRYTNEAGVIGRPAAVAPGEETSYRLTAAGRATARDSRQDEADDEAASTRKQVKRR